MNSRPLLNSGNVFTLTILVLGLTVLSVYLFGLGRHHTFFQNSLLSTTLLSITFFGFVSMGLYRGVKLRDTLGRVTDKIPFRRKRGNRQTKSSLLDIAEFLPSGNSSDNSDSIFDLGDLDGDEGCLPVLLGILAWTVAAVVLSVVLWLFGEILLVSVFAFMAMLYWIFFRALRLIFRHSYQTKGRLFASLGYGFVYTLLYNSWIYGIFLLIKYWQR